MYLKPELLSNAPAPMCIDHPPPTDQCRAYGGCNKNGKRLWAADTISSQNKAPRPVWTLSPNVAGHATDGSLIRHCDSHFFPIQPRLQPLDKPTQLLTHRRPRREQGDGGRSGLNGHWEDRIERDEEGCYKAAV
ncbi:hypothetical protein NQZ68_013310 [Dissostichus eleginoides]|nr:hypothetical protein NQZ68_013310 [Dissostichus eleginoides]